MNRHSPLELCRRLRVHNANLKSYIDALDGYCERGIAEKGGEENREDIVAIKGRIVDEVNRILSLMSPG